MMMFVLVELFEQLKVLLHDANPIYPIFFLFTSDLKTTIMLSMFLNINIYLEITENWLNSPFQVTSGVVTSACQKIPIFYFA